MTASSHPRPYVVHAQGLSYGYPGRSLFAGLGFYIYPGLTWVCGGDGSGKGTLLRIIGGELQPQAGQIECRAPSIFSTQACAADAENHTVARDWLIAQRAQHAGWDQQQAAELSAALGLVDHLHKPLFMWSTGSRRKLGLVAAAASAAQLTLLVKPFAALDAASGRVVAALLAEAAARRDRAWVLADYGLPPGLGVGQLATVINLGE